MSHLLYLDFETYYDAEYSLRRMTPAEYILDPRFETILCAVKADDGPHEVIDGPDLPRWLSQFPPQDTTTVTFNALFDNSILAWKYGFTPKTMLDPMAMARALLGHKLQRFNLAGIAAHFNFPAKGTAVHNMLGMRRADIIASPALWQSYCEYSKHDNWLNEHIFLALYKAMPWSERRLLDLTLRCCIEPRFMCDTVMLEGHIEDVKAAKEALLVAAQGVDKGTIMSTNKFRDALEALGVAVEMKQTASGGTAPAFAKTDAFMAGLLEHSDPAVAALAAARIGLKSTLEETRSETFYRIGNLPWPVNGGTMPIPLRYGGAHTHRLSGDWKMNAQNMPTVRGSKGKSKLRLALKAPPGQTVVTVDLGQIEARLVAWICKCGTLIEEFAKYDAGNKAYDPYNRLGSAIFQTTVDRKSSDPIQQAMGFIGKTGILGLGYGCGRDKFDSMVVSGARSMGVDISSIYSKELTSNAVTIYRDRYEPIQKGWRILQSAIERHLYAPAYGALQFGPVVISAGEVLLPSGLRLHYHNLNAVHTMVDWKKTGVPEQRTEYTYTYGGIPNRIYGPKLLENICQALARIIVMNAALRIRDCGLGTAHPEAYRFVMQAHDELVFIVPTAELEPIKAIIHREMVRRPSWGMDLPLTADINHGASYGEAK